LLYKTLNSSSMTDRVDFNWCGSRTYESFERVRDKLIDELSSMGIQGDVYWNGEHFVYDLDPTHLRG